MDPSAHSSQLTARTKHIVIDARIRRASTGRYADRLVEHLQDVDSINRYTILVQPDDSWQPKAKNFARVDCPFAQFTFNPLDQTRFTRQLNQLKPDLVHFTMNQQPFFYRGTKVTSTLDLTMLRFTRAGKTPVPVFWLKMLGYRFLFWYSNKKSTAIITITDYVKTELAKMYPFTKGKTSTTLLASEPPMAGAPVRPATLDSIYHLPSTNPQFLLYVGAPFPHKNLERLVKAFELISPKHKDLRLVLVGKKEYYYTQLEKRVSKLPSKNQIVFTGFVPDESLKWLYQNAVAYVCPSLSEGFGLGGLEAMVHGCPVVSSNATCLPEVYGDAAHYFDPENVEDMATRIDEVLTSPTLRTKLTALGHKQAAKYSWRRMAEQTLAVYNGVLGK